MEEREMKKIIILLVVAIFAISLPNFLIAGGQGEVKKKVITIGHSMPVVDTPYFAPYLRHFKEEVEKRGWKYILTDAGGDLNTQLTQIKELATEVDGLCIAPLDAAGVVSTIDKVYKESKGKLIIMTVNVSTDPKELSSLKASAENDCYTQGQLAAEAYVKVLDKKGIKKIQYCMAIGIPGYSSAIDRDKGFVDRLKELGVADRFIQLDKQPTNWRQDKSQDVTENWITTFGKELQMIYAEDDTIALGCATALKNAGYSPGQVLLNGVGGEWASVMLLKEGWIEFSIMQSPYLEAEMEVGIMADLQAGKKVKYHNVTPSPMLAMDNLDKYEAVIKEMYPSK